MARKIGAHVSTSGGLINALANIEAIGGNCLQIFAGSPRIWARSHYSDDESLEFKLLAAEKSLNPVFIHALYLVNLASDNPDLVARSRDSLISDLDNGQKINSAGVVIHLGSHQGRGFDAVKDQLVTVINEILAKTVSTPFIIENSAGQNGKIGTLPEIKYLFDAIGSDRLRLCLDTAHLYGSGIDINATTAIDSLVLRLLELGLIEKLVCIHLNGSKALLGSGRDLHENIGNGTIGTAGLSYFVTQKAFKDIPIILEVPGTQGHGPDKINLRNAQNLI